MSSSTEIKLGNKECLRYWALLKDTENLGQAVEAAMNLDSIADYVDLKDYQLNNGLKYSRTCSFMRI